jgi:hypothetical protein
MSSITTLFAYRYNAAAWNWHTEGRVVMLSVGALLDTHSCEHLTYAQAAGTYRTATLCTALRVHLTLPLHFRSCEGCAGGSYTCAAAAAEW